MDKKFQWSIFPKDNKEEQYVVRENNFADFIIAVNEIRNLIGIDLVGLKKQEGETKKAIPILQFEETCEKCGAKKILSKKGNLVCSEFCWTK
ncbi:MAG: hypothetical protein ACRDFB_00760 [Rhabdochlamydiaceae bacterium]